MTRYRESRSVSIYCGACGQRRPRLGAKMVRRRGLGPVFICLDCAPAALARIQRAAAAAIDRELAALASENRHLLDRKT